MPASIEGQVACLQGRAFAKSALSWFRRRRDSGFPISRERRIGVPKTKIVTLQSACLQGRAFAKSALEHIVAHPDQWLALLPVKFFHVWASDRYHVGYGVLPERYGGLVPVLWVVAQGYWTILVVAAGAMAVSRPIHGYWLKHPALLFPLALVYWAAFHLMTHGEGRFHAQMIPVVAIIAAHLLERDRDWGAWLPLKWRGNSNKRRINGKVMNSPAKIAHWVEFGVIMCGYYSTGHLALKYANPFRRNAI